MSQYLRVHYNPFDSTTNQPKIIDNSCKSSIGTKVRHIKELVADAGDPWWTGQYRDYGYCIMLVPGSCYSCIILKYKLTVNAVYDSRIFSYEILYVGNNATPFNIKYYAEGTDSFMHDTKGNYQSFRVVSQGMKLSSIGKSQDTSGFWEAIRLPLPNVNDMTLFRHDTITEGEQTYLVMQSGAYMKKVLPKDSTVFPWEEFPSYHVGRLKDLDQTQVNTEFYSTGRRFRNVEARKTNFDNATNTILKLYDTASDVEVMENFLDTYSSYWLFRISKPANDFRILVDVMTNYELVPLTTGPMVKFATLNNYTAMDIERVAAISNEPESDYMNSADNVEMITNKRVEALDEINSKNDRVEVMDHQSIENTSSGNRGSDPTEVNVKRAAQGLAAGATLYSGGDAAAALESAQATGEAVDQVIAMKEQLSDAKKEIQRITGTGGDDDDAEMPIQSLLGRRERDIYEDVPDMDDHRYDPPEVPDVPDVPDIPDMDDPQYDLLDPNPDIDDINQTSTAAPSRSKITMVHAKHMKSNNPRMMMPVSWFKKELEKYYADPKRYPVDNAQQYIDMKFNQVKKKQFSKKSKKKWGSRYPG